MQRVVIAGAGVIGLATALELAGRGYQVTVLDRGKALSEASWAAAGMLAAGDPENPPALAEFASFSRALYPEFLARLEELSGMSVPFRTLHTLQLADNIHADPAYSGVVIAHDEALRRVPGLQIGAGQSALWLEEQSLDPRDLCRALAAAVRVAGVELVEDSPVLTSFRTPGADRDLTITTHTRTYEAEAMIVASGAWAGLSHVDSLHALPAGSIEPRKGQMLRLRQPEGTSLTTVLRTSDIYIVPRANGSLIVGATVEDAGFDRAVYEEATEWLLHQAAQLWWPIAGITPDQVEEVWTGIRPATRDELPILGAVQGEASWPRVLFATGHYRNGILLAPGTARVMGQLLSGEDIAIDLKGFSPRRMMASSDLDASNPCSHDKETSAAL
jgi:glycine oxidase